MSLTEIFFSKVLKGAFLKITVGEGKIDETDHPQPRKKKTCTVLHYSSAQRFKGPVSRI